MAIDQRHLISRGASIIGLIKQRYGYRRVERQRCGYHIRGSAAAATQLPFPSPLVLPLFWLTCSGTRRPTKGSSAMRRTTGPHRPSSLPLCPSPSPNTLPLPLALASSPPPLAHLHLHRTLYQKPQRPEILHRPPPPPLRLHSLSLSPHPHPVPLCSGLLSSPLGSPAPAPAAPPNAAAPGDEPPPSTTPAEVPLPAARLGPCPAPLSALC